jgi:hypothetical protein
MCVCLNEVPVPSQESEPSCVRYFIKTHTQDGSLSWLGTGTLLRHIHMTAHFLGLVCLNKVPVPSQESERSCVCVLMKYLYQAKKVSRHVCVLMKSWYRYFIKTHTHDASLSWPGTGTLLRHTHMTAHFLGLVQVLY